MHPAISKTVTRRKALSVETDRTARDNYRALCGVLLTSLQTSRLLDADGRREDAELVKHSLFATLFNFDLSQLLRAIERTSGTWGASLYSRLLLLTMHECAKALSSLLGKPMRARLVDWGVGAELVRELSVLHSDLVTLTAVRRKNSRVARNNTSHRDADAAVQLERLSEVVVKDIHSRGYQLLAWTTRFHSFCSAVIDARKQQLNSVKPADQIVHIVRLMRAIDYLKENHPSPELIDVVRRITGQSGSTPGVSSKFVADLGTTRQLAAAKFLIALGAITQHRERFERERRADAGALANIAQFTILFLLDLSELLYDVEAAENEWSRIAAARYLATALHQFGESFPEVLPKGVQVHIYEAAADAELRARFRALKRRMDETIAEHQPFFARIRHSVVAHRVPDPLEQLQVMGEIRVEDVVSLGERYVAWCRELHDALTEIITTSHSLRKAPPVAS